MCLDWLVVKESYNFNKRCEFHDCLVDLFYYRAKFTNGQYKFWGRVGKDLKDLRFLKREATRI